MRREPFVLAGSVTDNEFGQVVDYLEEYGKLVDETERAGGVIGSVSQIYQVQKDYPTGVRSKLYGLQYQIRTPRTPQGTDFQYEFVELVNFSSPVK